MKLKRLVVLLAAALAAVLIAPECPAQPRLPAAAADPASADSSSFRIVEDRETVRVETATYVWQVAMRGFRYGFSRLDGTLVAPAHAVCGLQFGSTADVDLNRKARELADMTKGRILDATESTFLGREGEALVFRVTNTAGERAAVRVTPGRDRVRLAVRPEKDGVYAIVGRTGGITPAYGLADHGGLGRTSDDVTGFSSEYFGARTAPGKEHLEGRLISNFVIFPQCGLATVNVEPRKKIVRVTSAENAQGAAAVREMPSLYYFLGSPKTIYRELLEVRRQEGYPFLTPKYELFGVGWEAFGALGWTTSAQTVSKNINTYLELGYPLRWMVIGSGFWPGDKPELWGTTSFGMWNRELYPEPKAFLAELKGKGLTILLGLRIAFKQGNPYAIEAENLGHLLCDEKGRPINFQDSGKGATYLLNFESPRAVDWYVAMCRKWLDYGVDGFKEDLMFFLDRLERDDKVDPVNRALMQQGVQIMGRNMYFGSTSDLHRFNDFNFYESQDRGPINGLALSYAGFPFVYPDIVGGTGVWEKRGSTPDDVIAKYLMRYAQYAAVNPAMAFGYGPWSLNDPRVIEVTRAAAQLHARLHPYIYHCALESAQTGFPGTLTPLPLAYPDDPGVHGLANSQRRSYEWLIGESLLATPLFGDDYATAVARDVYLPAGKWIHYDTGEVFQGPTTLRQFPLPIGKTPLFVGGKGIVVEQEWDRHFAHVYPIANTDDLRFRFRSGATAVLRIAVDDWNDALIQVSDQTSGNVVQTRRRGPALVFPIEGGHEYLIRSLRMPEPVILERKTAAPQLPR